MENDEGDFILRDAAGSERFRIVLSAETLFIQVSGTAPKFTFMADVTEAEGLRKWLAARIDT